MNINQLSPSFDGFHGWLTINEAYAIFPQGKTWNELGLKLLNEIVAMDGTIFVLLENVEGKIFYEY